MPKHSFKVVHVNWNLDLKIFIRLLMENLFSILDLIRTHRLRFLMLNHKRRAKEVNAKTATHKPTMAPTESKKGRYC